MLAERNLFRTLAKPNLITQSGKAKFLSGAEFPYPVAPAEQHHHDRVQGVRVGLLFTPVVVDGDTINLRLRPRSEPRPVRGSSPPASRSP
jgi:Flp pilus assembly secretin CpaC